MSAVDHEEADNLSSRLSEMPKQPVSDLVVSTATQAKWALLASMVFPLLAGLFFMLSLNPLQERIWRHWMFVMLAIFPTPGLISLLVLLWSWFYARPLRKLAQGWYYVRWIIPPDLWERECERATRQNQKLGLIVVGLSLLGGLSFAVIAWSEGDIFFGGAVRHFFVVAAISAGLGLILAVVLSALANVTVRLMKTRTAQVIIGPEGVYITGQYWPFSAPAQTLENVQFHNEESHCLKFIFRVSTQHGPRNRTLNIPFPPERKSEAMAIPKILGKYR